MATKAPKSAPEKLLYSIPDVATAIGCSTTHVYELIARGDIRVVNIAIGPRSKSRVRHDDLTAFINRMTREAPKQATA